MTVKNTLLRLTLAITVLLAPLPVGAVDGYGTVNGIVSTVGSMLPSFAGLGSTAACDGADGACSFIVLVLDIINRIRPLVSSVAVIIIVIMGTRMIIGQEDDRLEKTRTAMTALISGLVIIWISEPFVNAFYGSTGERFRGEMAGGAALVDSEVSGIIRWVLVLAATLAVTMLIYSAFRAILKASSEDGIAEMRRAMIAAVSGIILLALHRLIAVNFVSSPESPVPVLGIVAMIVGYVMTFLALVLTGIVIYAGLRMVFNNGSEEVMEKSKGLLLRAAVGVVVIILSLVLVNLVIVPLTNPGGEVTTNV